jgi:two-component system, chemotaxis family, chemotaxis protein CheY
LPSSAQFPAETAKVKVLLVDDDQIARMSLSNIVSGMPGVAGVVEAEDGEQAWALLAAGLRPALCCCDIRMPRLDGLGLLQRVRGHRVLRHLPMVLISSASDRETVQTAIAGGVAGYILKPFLAAQTRSTLQRVLCDRQATESEPVHVTRRRLGLDGEQLRGLLRDLQDAAAAAHPRRTRGGTSTGQLRPLHDAAVQLGLWRGAGLLAEAMKDPDPVLHDQVLDELTRLVDVQLAGPGLHAA